MGSAVSICPPKLADCWAEPFERVGMIIEPGPPGAKLEALPETSLDLAGIVRSNGHEAYVWMDVNRFVRHPLCAEGGGYNFIILGRDNGKSYADRSFVIRLYWSLCARGLRGMTFGYTVLNDVRSPVGELVRGGVCYRVLSYDLLSKKDSLPAGCANSVSYSFGMRHEVHWGPSMGPEGPTRYIAFRSSLRLPFTDSLAR